MYEKVTGAVKGAVSSAWSVIKGTGSVIGSTVERGYYKAKNLATSNKLAAKKYRLLTLAMKLIEKLKEILEKNNKSINRTVKGSKTKGLSTTETMSKINENTKETAIFRNKSQDKDSISKSDTISKQLTKDGSPVKKTNDIEKLISNVSLTDKGMALAGKSGITSQDIGLDKAK